MMEPPTETEARSRARAERFARFVDVVDAYAIILLDADGRIESWNAGAARIDGYRREEIIGEHVSIFQPPQDRAASVLMLEAAARDGRVELETVRVRKDGSRYLANVVVTAIRDDDGTLVGFGNIARDLSERRREEEALGFDDERFRLIVESVRDYAIFMIDPTGHVVTWNAGAERMKGYRADEIIGRHFSVFYPEEDLAAGKCEMELECAQAEDRFDDEGWRVRKDGSTFWANVIITALRDANGTLVGFAKVTRDLTLRRRAEEERARLIQAEEANRVKDEFLATVSHELRTPLNAILGWATLLKDRVQDPSAVKAAETIRRNALAQARIIEDVLDVSRIITGKLLIDAKPMDLAAIVREAIQVVTPAANAKEISIAFEETTDLTLLVGDAARLQQVVWNLLSNAVKFTDRRGSVVVRIEQHGSSLRLSVRDTGCGIAPEWSAGSGWGSRSSGTSSKCTAVA
jgi:PAS domain S-box-containing protein